ncbi:MAG: hypothetical protein GY820_02235 [Gammaproteobacteria bacterium]|nr:hypothetical protein [Gammaproteobacteria bacterium]
MEKQEFYQHLEVLSAKWNDLEGAENFSRFFWEKKAEILHQCYSPLVRKSVGLGSPPGR